MPRPVSGIVMHSTAGGNLSGAIDTLRESGNSYNYIIDHDGTITKCTPAGMRANHAGVSHGWDGDSLNDYALGISFVHLNDGHTPVKPAQVDAAAQIVAELVKAYPTIKHITTHRDVSPGRKTDPNPFPITEFAKRVGLDYWQVKS